MGESAPPSPGRRSPTPPGVADPPPTVYTPLVAHHDDDDDGGVPETETTPSSAGTNNNNNNTKDIDDGDVRREPSSPTARTPLVQVDDYDDDVDDPDIPEVVVASMTPSSTTTAPATSDVAMMMTPQLGRLMTPAQHHALSGFPSYLESGTSLHTLCTPLMESKSETCSYILPPTAGCSTSGSDPKSETNSVSGPLCRICHMNGEEGEILISPCRCSGTLQFIHNTCLMRWLEILTKKSRKPPKCELCHFQYHRHKKFKFHHWRFPRVSRQDKILHIIFIVNLVMMIGCAVATVMSFLSDEGSLNHTPPGNNVELSTEEIITLSCGVLFFVSFFIAMSVQIKAKHTIYQLVVKFIMQNMEWEIDEYDKSKDTLYKDLYKGLPVYV